VQLLIVGHEHLAQASLGMWPQNAKPQALSGRLAEGDGRDRIVLGRCGGSGDVHQARLHIGIGDLPQVFADGSGRAHRRQAQLDIVAVQGEVLLH
jgi:hypothetical protein